MSTIKVEVIKISDVRPHGNADALELATVGGWQVCIPKGRYKDGDSILYFEQGTTLSREQAEKFGVVNYLSEKTNINGDRVLVVHRVKLRGEPSFGLVVSPEPDMVEGVDYAEHYGAAKFVPPVKMGAGDAIADDPKFPAYTDIENMRSYPDIFHPGEEVVATEKIHGTNCRVGFVQLSPGLESIGIESKRLLAGSRTLNRKQPATMEECRRNTYWFPFTLDCVNALMSALSLAGHKQAVLYGEVYGQGVQSYNYGSRQPAFRAFDLMVDGKYVGAAEFKQHCETYDIPMVPIVYQGPFALDTIAHISNGPTLVSQDADRKPDHGREGVVVRPVNERTDVKVGRVILKYVGDDYLFSKAAQNDTTDQ